MVAPLSDVPQEGSSVFSLFSLIKLHLASLPLASSYSRVAVSSVFCAQSIFFGPNAWGPVKHEKKGPGFRSGKRENASTDYVVYNVTREIQPSFFLLVCGKCST